jgi:hypothetical protein
MTEGDHIRAHRHATCNREEVLTSHLCGCFYCLALFPPAEIDRWIADQGGDTAVCPHCQIDSVIGSRSGYLLTREFLEQMHAYWFSTA